MLAHVITVDRLTDKRNSTQQKCDEHTQSGNDGTFNRPRQHDRLALCGLIGQYRRINKVK